jgi:hypothetical protein
MINFNNTYSVVDYALAREILWKAGMGARREADILLITMNNSGHSLYYTGESCASLYVDEGIYSGTMMVDNGEIICSVNRPWMELVDYGGLLYALCIGYDNYKIPPCEYHGRGRQKDHQIFHCLQNLKLIQESRGIDWFCVSL